MGWWIVVTSLTLILVQLRSSEGLNRKKFVVQPHPIQFNEEPHDWTVTQGASVNLTCNTTVIQVNGYINEDTTPLPKFRWFHNNVMINSSDHYAINSYGIDTSILTIRNVTSLEQGEYYCVVNEWPKPDGDWWIKTRSRSGYITVIDRSSTLTVNSEEHVVLSCREPMTMVPNSTVVWLKDGVKINVKHVTDCHGNLMLLEAEEYNSGHYYCIDPVNNSTILSYYVTVNSQDNAEDLIKPQLLTDAENHFIRIRPNDLKNGCGGSPVNQFVTLKCNVSSPATIRWYKNGELLDLDTEGMTFNQTTGDLIIRREDACELLGVYQCFASNEIDTVHVSTRVLPLGWPNYPGRPKLISKTSNSNGFKIGIKLYQPDFLGGLTPKDGLQYDIYLSYSYNLSKMSNNIFKDNVDASNFNTITTIDLTSNVLITGFDSVKRVYNITAQIKISNQNLEGIAALPTGSPSLRIDTLCNLIDLVVPTVEETCHYNTTTDLVTHNISWHLTTIQNGISFKNDDVDFWYISGGCNYSNGTSAGKSYSNQITNKRNLVWELPGGSSCHVSVHYDTSCKPSQSSSNQQCNYVLPTNRSVSDDGMSPSPEGKINSLLIALVIALLMMIIVVGIIFCFCFYFRRYSQHKPSTIQMLENARELRMLQMSCPISDDQRSVITSQTVSEAYAEKVNKWMEKLEDVTEIDSNVFEFDPSEMLEQIVNGNVTCKNAALSHYIDCKALMSDNEILPAGIITPTNISSQPSSELSRNRTVNDRLLSVTTADSGVDSSADMDGNVELTDSDVLNLQYFSTSVKRIQSTVPDHYICNSSDSNTSTVPCHYLCDASDCKSSDYDKLTVTSSGINRLQLTRVIESDSEFNDQGNASAPISTKEIGEYIGLETAYQDECLPRSMEEHDKQISVEMANLDHCMLKSTEKHGEYIGLEAVNQSQHHRVSHKELLNFDHENYDNCNDEVIFGSHETKKEYHFNDNGYVTSSMFNNIRVA